MFRTDLAKSNLKIFKGLKARKMHSVKIWDTHGILIYSASQGSGKSLTAHKLIHDCKKKIPDLTIVSNVPLGYCDYIPFSWENLEELDRKGIVGMIIFIDEISNVFCNTDKVDPKFLWLANQLRKREALVIGTCPLYSRINKAFREQFSCLCIPEIKFGCLQINHYYSCNEATMALAETTDELIKGLKLEKTQFFFHTPADYERYDTTKIIKRED